MAESDNQKTLAEEWSLPANEQQSALTAAPVEKATNEEKPAEVASGDVVEKITNESESAPTEVTSVVADADESAPAEDTSETTKEEVAEEEETEEARVVKIETAPADFRFPTTNQTRHCFTRYIEYHRCIAAKGEDAPECNKFAKYYRSLCPSEWVERWNEQRENGTFPGPL